MKKINTLIFTSFLETKELKQEYESLFGIRPNGAVSGPDLFSWITKSKHGMNSQAMTISLKLKKFYVLINLRPQRKAFIHHFLEQFIKNFK